MPTTATLQRRLIRTKEAATYLSMSDWNPRDAPETALRRVAQPPAHS